ncbi:MAG TPA: MFS transporter [Crenalkalicoccus sp.]|jgi:putative MFS transporter|nr:MFS transporter [Crenalkalicoccus sp.]
MSTGLQNAVPLRPGAAAATALTGGTAASVAARLDRLPASRAVWTLVVLLSLGGWFEFYDLFLTGYIAPALLKEGLYTAGEASPFAAGAFASFIASFFAGLFIGTMLLGWVADRFGRRTIFTLALLWYSAAMAVMAFQHSAQAINLWRFLAGLGVGVELVTIDTYLAELIPPALRGRAFAANQAITFSMVPVVALVGWLLVPTAPLGFAGWRWMMLIGATGAIAVWWIRRALPESPRWLAQHGRTAEADAAMRELEARVAAETGPLPPPAPAPAVQPGRGSLAEAFRPPLLSRTVMMSVVSVLQTVGFYGFANWVPTLLIAEGIGVTHSLFYTFLIALANPFGPILAYALGDRVDRKWQFAGACAALALTGLWFGAQRAPALIVVAGLAVTLSATFMSYALHAYQAELFPTRIRARAVGFVYSWSRLSVVCSGYIIAWVLAAAGTNAVFALIAGAMLCCSIILGLFGPRTSGQALEHIAH